jgi:hypothetical protein
LLHFLPHNYAEEIYLSSLGPNRRKQQKEKRHSCFKVLSDLSAFPCPKASMTNDAVKWSGQWELFRFFRTAIKNESVDLLY